MALFVCKCLNVTLESDKVEDNVDISKLELTSTEQRDNFFSEKLLSTPLSALKIQVVQPVLTGQRAASRWLLHCCLACGQATHAISQDRLSVVLIPAAIQTTQDRVNSLKSSSNFSPVFNLLVPEVTSVDMKENVDTNNLVRDRNGWQPTHQAIGTLSKQLSQMLQSQLESIEETVRQFRDQKYAEFEAYRERAHRDHKILSSFVSKPCGNPSGDGFRVDPSLDNGPPSPQLPPLQRRRLSSFKDAKKMPQPIIKQTSDLPPEEDSLEAEDIFDLEGMDSRNNMISDQEDDYDDSDADVSHDEGIAITRGRGGAVDLARSLPINVPIFPGDRTLPRDIDEDEEPADIAASIKALARSVHGDVYELPRPRFSTMI
ncbi:proline-rich Akt substrate 40 kDa [Choristoneura fumiferana]|uniref:proline-rich Akt substrate 40 kDa n=1 Tax=Choristoneura fumiferana TaxID=7141 RepID=UPI003D15549A